MKLIKTFTAAFATMVIGASAFAIDGTEIMQHVYDRQKPDTSKASALLTLVDAKGVSEKRQVGEYGRCKDNLSDVVMIFFSPAAVKDTRFLQKENKGRDDDKWIYLPAMKSVRRIGASNGSESFVGTEFSYDDMSTREVDEDKHELLKESEDKGNFKDLYVVKSTPLNPKSSQYSYRISWVTKDSWIPVYIELYDKKGKLNKINEIRVIEQKTGKKTYNVPMENVMTNVQNKRKTVIKMLKVEVDIPLDDKYFTQSFLSTGK